MAYSKKGRYKNNITKKWYGGQIPVDKLIDRQITKLDNVFKDLCSFEIKVEDNDEIETFFYDEFNVTNKSCQTYRSIMKKLFKNQINEISKETTPLIQSTQLLEEVRKIQNIELEIKQKVQEATQKYNKEIGQSLQKVTDKEKDKKLIEQNLQKKEKVATLLDTIPTLNTKQSLEQAKNEVDEANIILEKAKNEVVPVVGPVGVPEVVPVGGPEVIEPGPTVIEPVPAPVGGPVIEPGPPVGVPVIGPQEIPNQNIIKAESKKINAQANIEAIQLMEKINKKENELNKEENNQINKLQNKSKNKILNIKKNTRSQLNGLISQNEIDKINNQLQIDIDTINKGTQSEILNIKKETENKKTKIKDEIIFKNNREIKFLKKNLSVLKNQLEVTKNNAILIEKNAKKKLEETQKQRNIMKTRLIKERKMRENQLKKTAIKLKIEPGDFDFLNDVDKDKAITALKNVEEIENGLPDKSQVDEKLRQKYDILVQIIAATIDKLLTIKK